MPPSPAMHPAVQAAFFVERYAVYDEFAAGGMATVHFARLNGAQGFRRTVAVKRLLPHLTRDHDFALMLIDEARLASRVRHHNVVSTLDVVQTRDELLLVMDYVHGESLAKLMRWSTERQEPVPVAIATAIIIDALHGLHAAHQAKDEQGAALGLVHRDVSPQNVLVGLDGITRIADFGVAKAAGRAHSTQDGAVKGKLAYMAPEQLSGGEVSCVSDVFATAIVLWEVLTGERLFAGRNHAETVFKVMSAPMPRPSDRRASLPPELDAIVLRGLERDPARRYASAREMALALEQSAPSVRPSEIASWVERIVGDRLTLRARTLHAIERDVERQTDALTAVRDPAGPADAWHALAPTDAAPEVETGTHRKEPSSRSAPHQLQANVESANAPLHHADDKQRGHKKRATFRVLVGGGLLALVSLLGAATWTLMARRVPTRSTAPGQLLPNAAENPVTHALDQTSTIGGAQAASVSPLPVSATSVDAAIVAPELSSPVLDRAGVPADKRRVLPARKRGSPACDPPYSIDPTGRVLFKVECM